MPKLVPRRRTPSFFWLLQNIAQCVADPLDHGLASKLCLGILQPCSKHNQHTLFSSTAVVLPQTPQSRFWWYLVI